MNPTGAPEPPGDSSRIVGGIFVLPVGARERTHGCSPRASGRFGQNRLGGFSMFVSGRGFPFRWRVHASAPAGVAPEPQAVWAEPAGGVVSAGVYACFLV